MSSFFLIVNNNPFQLTCVIKAAGVKEVYRRHCSVCIYIIILLKVVYLPEVSSNYSSQARCKHYSLFAARYSSSRVRYSLCAVSLLLSFRFSCSRSCALHAQDSRGVALPAFIICELTQCVRDYVLTTPCTIVISRLLLSLLSKCVLSLSLSLSLSVFVCLFAVHCRNVRPRFVLESAVRVTRR